MLLALLAACKTLEPASAEVEGSAEWLYAHAATASHAELAASAALLADDLGADALAEPLESTMAALSAEAVAAVGRVAVESLPAEEQAAVTDEQLASGAYVRLDDMQGLLVVTVIPCGLDAVEELLAAENQDELHGGYDAYERRWDGDGADYFAREADTLTWTTDYTVTVANETYSATIEGGLRRAATDGTDAFPHGDVIVGQAVLPSPGVFSSGDGYFRQDYQLDVLWERAAGETVHVYGQWRDLLVAGFHSKDELTIATVSNRLVAADEEIAELCAGR